MRFPDRHVSNLLSTIRVDEVHFRTFKDVIVLFSSLCHLHLNVNLVPLRSDVRRQTADTLQRTRCPETAKIFKMSFSYFVQLVTEGYAFQHVFCHCVHSGRMHCGDGKRDISVITCAHADGWGCTWRLMQILLAAYTCVCHRGVLDM